MPKFQIERKINQIVPERRNRLPMAQACSYSMLM